MGSGAIDATVGCSAEAALGLNSLYKGDVGAVEEAAGGRRSVAVSFTNHETSIPLPEANMHFSLAAPVLLAAFAGSVHAQDASPTTSTEPTGTAALELEEQRAECFKDCYREYGDTATCDFGQGEDQFMACWCTVDDWTSREEDCVRSVCGNDAYNGEYLVYASRRGDTNSSQSITSSAPECARLS